MITIDQFILLLQTFIIMGDFEDERCVVEDTVEILYEGMKVTTDDLLPVDDAYEAASDFLNWYIIIGEPRPSWLKNVDGRKFVADHEDEELLDVGQNKAHCQREGDDDFDRRRSDLCSHFLSGNVPDVGSGDLDNGGGETTQT